MVRVESELLLIETLGTQIDRIFVRVLDILPVLAVFKAVSLTLRINLPQT